MADFIDKSRLLADYQQDLCGHIPCHECPFLVPNGHGSTECSLERYISEQPTVDAEPVKYGRWINANEGKWNTVEVLKCSICGESDNRMDRSDAYCPHCGAKMQGDSDGDK